MDRSSPPFSPPVGSGVDFSLPTLVDARRRHPDLDFVCGDVERLPIAGTFDYVIVSNVVGYLIDVQDLFRELMRVTHPSSRVIVAYYNFAWEPVLWLAERFGMKTREPLQSWLSNDGLANLAEMADLELVKSGYRTPLPVGPAWLTQPGEQPVVRGPTRQPSRADLIRHGETAGRRRWHRGSRSPRAPS